MGLVTGTFGSKCLAGLLLWTLIWPLYYVELAWNSPLGDESLGDELLGDDF
jgi:hypothetical protein